MRPKLKYLALVLAVMAALIAVPSVAAAGGDDDDDDGGGHVGTYEVTITNNTPGQILTPPVFAAHTKGFDLFSKGQPASVWLKEVAENGNVGPLAASLESTRGVRTAGVGNGPDPVFAGESRTWTFETRGYAKYLSTASMIVCTNDGFTGLDGQRLPKRMGKSIEIDVYAYDAGTETNTELLADLVPPCSGGLPGGSGVSNPATFESGVVHNHGGVTGAGDLDAATWGWEGPVATFVITRTA